MDIFKKLISYATKAPSGHNSQPWKFKILENGIEIHADFESSLPIVDPHNRELFISLGCATENLCAAAADFGFSTKWSTQKKSTGGSFIKIDLEKSEMNSQKGLIELIENRQTNRSVFNGDSISQQDLNELTRIPGEDNINMYYYKNGGKDFLTIKEYIKKGNEIQMNDPNFKNELLSWIRFNKSHIEKTNNGLTYKVMAAPPMPKVIGKLIVKSFLNPKKQNKSDRIKIDSSSHFILLTTRDNSELEWISLGIYLQKLLLKLTELGIAYSYLNPPCEIETLSNELKKEISINNEYPSIIMRVGYAKKVAFSPRKNVNKVIYE